MKPIKLKKLISKQDLKSLLTSACDSIGCSYFIRDTSGVILYGKESIETTDHFPIFFQETQIGEVCGSPKAILIRDIIHHQINQEIEKREIVDDSLEKYKEISLLYKLGEYLSRQLDVHSIAQLIIEESMENLPGRSLAVYLNEEGSENLNLVSKYSKDKIEFPETLNYKEGIVGSIFQSGVAEIINDVNEDNRFVHKLVNVRSMICVPLSINYKVFGVALIANKEVNIYKSMDLKLFTAIASHCAFAMENAILYRKKLEEDRIRANLRRYVSSQLVDAIIDSKGEITLEPNMQNITILFSDIRSFTQKCERLPADKIVNYLNTYFSKMVDVIFNHEGTINKFVGDMIVALFGAPRPTLNNEKNAVEAAINMQKLMKSFPDDWIRDNFHTGIGISCGDVVVGNIGSKQHMDYTAIGDRVNIASRLQSLAAGGQILVTDRIYELTKGQFSYKKFDTVVKLKGKEEAIEIYEVIQE